MPEAAPHLLVWDVLLRMMAYWACIGMILGNMLPANGLFVNLSFLESVL